MFKYYNFLNFKNNNKTYQTDSTKSNLIIPFLEEQNNIVLTEAPKLTEEELFQRKIQQLEETPQKTFLELNPTIDEKLRLSQINNFLYHGIRFKNQLEKLEQIIESGYLLAGNYQQNTSYYDYDDNCNGGEYISLTANDDNFNLCFETFVKPNLALIINPACNAKETFYLPYDEWEKIKDINTKNRYSYVRGEYQVKERIPLDLVSAIGVPINLLKSSNQEYLIETYLKKIIILLRKYNLDLPIVDHSNYNEIIYMPVSCNKEETIPPKQRILKLK